MKKIFLIFCLIAIVLLCSCRKINQPENNNYTSSNSSDVNSDFSSVTSELVLPERDEPTTSVDQESNISSDETVTSDNTVLSTPQLTITIDKTYYRSSISAISFTLFNEKRNKFTYKNDFFLQQYKDGEWKAYKTKSGEFDYEVLTIDTESHIEFVIYDLKKLYDTPLEFGTYRFVLETDYGTITSNSFKIMEDSFFDGPQ